MTEFKETMYVHSFQVKQGYVVFNTLYGYLDLLSNDLYNKFKKGKYQEIDKNSLDILLDHRFIINNKLNEESLFNSYISLYEHNRNKEKNIYILFSYECNFNCTYCFEHDMKGKETSNNNLNKIFRYVEKQLENNKVRLVLYGGEPLLLQNYNKIEKVLSFAQKNNIKVKIITNGYLLDVFSKLLLKYKRNIDYLLITLDGDKDQHDLTRKKKNKEGTYKKIVENILMADKLKIKTKIRVNVGMENQKYIIDFLLHNTICKTHDVSIHFIENNRCLASNTSVIARKNRIIIDLYNICLNQKNLTLEYPPLKQIDLMVNEDDFVLPLFDYCNSSNIILFDNDGNMYNCTEACEDERFLMRNDETVYYTNDHICKSCYLAPICGGGCRWKRYQSRIENDLSCQKEIINLIELFIKNFLEENAYGV
ncbi:MAG: radical SAM protein [Holdemanella biformis]|nr:radical SAM protein [Holdemanella biformis]MEE0474344.1 radical SAM protein [Holdemanella biformis]